MSHPFRRILMAQALAGLVAGAALAVEDAHAKKPKAEQQGDNAEQPAEKPKHECKGKNECKGENKCKGEHECKGKNECKGENKCKGENECKGKDGCKGDDKDGEKES